MIGDQKIKLKQLHYCRAKPQKAATAYFTSKQLLPFGFEEHNAGIEMTPRM